MARTVHEVSADWVIEHPEPQFHVTDALPVVTVRAVQSQLIPTRMGVDGELVVTRVPV